MRREVPDQRRGRFSASGSSGQGTDCRALQTRSRSSLPGPRCYKEAHNDALQDWEGSHTKGVEVREARATVPERVVPNLPRPDGADPAPSGEWSVGSMTRPAQ